MNTQQQADEAVVRLKALQQLTATTGTITNKAQRELLRSLPPDVMILVAETLYRTKNPISNPVQNPETENAKDSR